VLAEAEQPWEPPAALPADIEQQVQAAVAAVRAAKPVGGRPRLAAVRALRQLLSHCGWPALALGSQNSHALTP
jgi:hypothetical protein